MGHEDGGDSEMLGAEDANERDGCPGGRVERDARHIADRLLRKQRNRRDRPVRPNTDARHDAIAGPLEPRNGRDHSEVDLTAGKQARALRGHVEAKGHGVGPLLESVDQGPDVQIADRAEPDGTCHDSGS